MDFPQAIAAGFQGYVRFTGRSSRSEYWFWVLFVLIVSAITGVLDAFLFPGGNFGVFGPIWSLAILLPSIAVSVRRLHDIDKSGWWYLLWLVLIIGWILLIVWACRKGDEMQNRFGSDPLAGLAAA